LSNTLIFKKSLYLKFFVWELPKSTLSPLPICTIARAFCIFIFQNKTVKLKNIKNNRNQLLELAFSYKLNELQNAWHALVKMLN